MPLYTYIATFQGRANVDQDRRSNYSGFAPLVLGRMAERGLLGASKSSTKEMVEKAYRSAWAAVPGCSNVWSTAFDLAGSTLELYAVQTKD